MPRPRPAKRAKLLSDDEASGDDAPAFKVNADYAARFEYNKKREEQQRLEEKYGRDEDEDEDGSSSDETEDSEAELATQHVDEEIMATLNAIKKKDPRVYDKEVKFYREFEPPTEKGKEKKDKPMYLQDYHRKNLLEGANGDGEEDDDAPRTYQQEQEGLRQEVVGRMHEAAGREDEAEGDDFLVAKKKPKHVDVDVPKPKQITDADVAEADKDPETYLSNFMASRAWLPTSTSKWQAFDSDDSEDDRRAEGFEEAYNMRFEDPEAANEKLRSFARDVGKFSVRRDEKKSARQRTRDRERERKEAERREREEEKARLRKLKIEDAEAKVRRIREAAGLGKGEGLDLDAWKDVIEGDFDDEKWEDVMKERFGDQYYTAPDAVVEDESEDGGAKKRRRLKKPKWEDDIDIKDLVPEFEDEEARPDITLSDDDLADGAAVQAGAESSDDEDAMDIDTTSKPRKSSKKARADAKAEAKRIARRERRQIESLVDANLPVDTANPQKTADVPSFRYRETSPTTFGLSAKDILFADDAKLNEFVGLKKLAAWREPDKKAKDRRKFSKKQRLREWRKETFGNRDGPVLSNEQSGPPNTGAGEGEVKKAGKKRKRSKKVKTEAAV